MNQINILNYQPVHQPIFESLSRVWIEQLFEMEPIDEWVLTNPEKAIIEPGGAILMASYDGTIAGTVALRKIDDHTFEITKMSVDPAFRRRGIAEALIYASYRKAWKLGATHIILYASNRSTGAAELYQKAGFQFMPIEKDVYKRADVKMGISIEEAMRKYHQHVYAQLTNN